MRIKTSSKGQIEEVLLYYLPFPNAPGTPYDCEVISVSTPENRSIYGLPGEFDIQGLIEPRNMDWMKLSYLHRQSNLFSWQYLRPLFHSSLPEEFSYTSQSSFRLQKLQDRSRTKVLKYVEIMDRKAGYSGSSPSSLSSVASYIEYIFGVVSLKREYSTRQQQSSFAWLLYSVLRRVVSAVDAESPSFEEAIK